MPKQKYLRGSSANDSVTMIFDPPKPFPLSVREDAEPEGLVGAAKLDHFERNVLSWQFEDLAEIAGDTAGQLLHAEQRSTSRMLYGGIAEAGQRPCTLRALLAFAARYPKIQRRYEIFALGSVAKHDRKLWVPVLRGDEYRRTLELGWIGDNWRTDHRFLTFKSL